jgi:hypothetical protein
MLVPRELPKDDTYYRQLKMKGNDFMLKNHFVRLMDIPRRTLIIVVALMAGLGIVASAFAKEPTGDLRGLQTLLPIHDRSEFLSLLPDKRVEK